MINNELKVEISNDDLIENLIKNAYFVDGYMGKLLTNKHYIEIDKNDSTNYIIFKNLNNETAKISNINLIDGYLRVIISETEYDNIKLYPISMYCITENKKYIFY